MPINSGWAADVDDGDRKYDQQFKQAATFAQSQTLGVYDLCGGFGLRDAPVAAATEAPPAPLPMPTEAPPAREPSGCDPNYTGCVPNASYDLDCADIGFMVQVVGGDPHRFDRGGDGWGCKSYG